MVRILGRASAFPVYADALTHQNHTQDCFDTHQHVHNCGGGALSVVRSHVTQSSFHSNSVRSAMRSFALRARGFSTNSSSLGRIGFLVIMRTFGLLPHTQTGNWAAGATLRHFLHCFFNNAIFQRVECNNAQSPIGIQALYSTGQHRRQAAPNSSLTAMRIA